MQTPPTLSVTTGTGLPSGAVASMRVAVRRLGLSAALVVRISGRDDEVEITGGWPATPDGAPGGRALRAVHAVAEGRRGFSVWRVGARRHAALLSLFGDPPPDPAGTVLATRLTPVGHHPADVLVGVLPAPDAPVTELAETLADVLEARRGRRAMPPGPRRPRRGDPRMRALLDAGIELGAQESVDDVLQTLVHRAREITSSRYAAVAVLDPSGTGIERFIAAGVDTAVRAAIGEPPTGQGVLGALLTDHRTLRLDSIGDDPRFAGFPDGHPEMTTLLGTPIALGGHVFGIVYLADRHDGPYTTDDERVVEVLAAQAAAAVAVARRLDTERQRVRELEQMQRTVRSVQEGLVLGMHEHRPLDEVLPMLIEHVMRLDGAEAACAALVEDGALVVRAASTGFVDISAGTRTHPTVGAFAAAMRSAAGRPVEVVPLLLAGELVGALGAAGEEISEDGARAVLSAIGSQLVMAVATERAVESERLRAGADAALALANASQQATADGFRRAIQAQEAERARIARELHDEAGQVLTAVAVHLRVLEDREGDEAHRSLLTDLRHEVVGAATHLHELITDLRPVALREHGLGVAITHQAQRMSMTSGIVVDVNVRALPVGLPEEAEVAIFRVVQEALTNIARHSTAASGSVTAAVEGTVLRVVVEDDGRGFDPTAATARHGLAGIRERVALLGGRLHVDSAPGRGAAVIVELDLLRD